MTTGIQKQGIDFDSGCVFMLESEERLSEGLKRRNTDVMLQDDEMTDPL